MKHAANRTIVVLTIAITLFLAPSVVWARSTFKDVGRNFVDTGTEIYGANPPSLQATVGNIIKGGLGLLGIVFIVLIVYAGYVLMTARGEEKKVTEAKDTITSAIIGLAITLGAYAITDFVVDALVSATGI